MVTTTQEALHNILVILDTYTNKIAEIEDIINAESMVTDVLAHRMIGLEDRINELETHREGGK